MNKQDRKDLEKALALLEQVKIIIETIKDGEQEKFDNLPEGLQQTEKAQKFEEAVSSLDDALNNIDEAIYSITETIE